MPFAQLVVGPPGSGKSTYCDGMQQFMSAIGRKCSIVNLDPANDRTSYPCALDVRELVRVEEIMADEDKGLGPNGSVLYALEDLEIRFDWLSQKLKTLGEDYVLFDCPGQVELFTHHSSMRKIFFKIQKLGYRLVVVHLVDSSAITRPSLYISTLLLSLRTMLQMDLTHINVLTKIDLLSTYSPLPFNLEYYTKVQDLDQLLPVLAAESPMFGTEKFSALNEAIAKLVEEYGLVGYETLAVEDKKSMMSLLHTIDRAGGYVFGGAEGANDTVWQVAVREGMGEMDIRDVQERWLDQKEYWDEMERMEREEEAKMRNAEANLAKAGEEDFDETNLNIPPNSGIKVTRSS